MANQFSKNIDEQINQLEDIEAGATANAGDWTGAEHTEIQTTHTNLRDKKSAWEAKQAEADMLKEDLENYAITTAAQTYKSFRDKAYGKYTKKGAKLNDYGFIPQGERDRTPAAPDIPANFKATLSADRTFNKLRWDKPRRAKSFELWYGTSTDIASDTPPAKQFLASPPGTSYKHTGVAKGVKYYYWLKAVGTGGESDFTPDIYVVAG